MRKTWLRELTDFSIVTTVFALAAFFVLMLVDSAVFHSTGLFFTYGVPSAIVVGVLDAIAIGLNIKFYEPTPMRAIPSEQARKQLELSIAEWFIRDNDALYRHYTIAEVVAHVKQFKGIVLTDGEAINLVQLARDEAGMGPIADYNLPGYVDKEAIYLPERKLDAVGWPAIPPLNRSDMDDFDLLVEQQDQEIVHDSDLSL